MKLIIIGSENIGISIGVGTTAQALYSTVVGTYNEILGSPASNNSWDPVFVVGNGGGNTYRSSAFTVVKNGGCY